MNTKTIIFGLIVILLLSGMVDIASAGADPLLEYGEIIEIHISLPRDLSANDECKLLLISPPVENAGTIFLIKTKAPATIDPVMLLNILPLSTPEPTLAPGQPTPEPTSFVELCGDVIGHSADGEHLTEITLTLRLSEGCEPVNMNDIAVKYSDDVVSLKLITPMGDKPRYGKGQWNYSFLESRSTPEPTLAPIVTPAHTVDMVSADTNALLVQEEEVEIHVSLPRDLCANGEFTIEIQPLTGGPLTITSMLPGVLDSVMCLTRSIEQATSHVELAGDVIGRSADGEYLTEIELYLKLTAGAKPVNLNEMILIYTDKNTYVTLTPMEDKPLSGKGQWNFHFLLTIVTPKQTSTPLIMSTPTPRIPTPIYAPSPEELPYDTDSDSDGVPDEYDYAPHDPEVQTKSDAKTPGFGVIFAIGGLFVVASLILRRRG